MKKLFIKIVTITLSLLFILTPTLTNAVQSPKLGTYFTGIGCPYCAKVSPKLHEQVESGSLILLEYEIYKTVANAQIFNTYIDNYDLGLGIPQLMFGKENKNSGDTPILDNLDTMIAQAPANTVFLQEGESTTFDDFNLNSLGRYPKIFAKDRVVVRDSINNLTEQENEQIKSFIFSPTVEEGVEKLEGKKITPEVVATSGVNLKYENAIKINGWILQWNGDGIEGAAGNAEETNGNDSTTNSQDSIQLSKILSLAVADSINPCALSVLGLVLISIITYNPRKRKQILYAGLAFVFSVFIMYLLYGVLIIKAFEVIQSIGSVREFLFGKLGLNLILGVGALILGILGIKDYISYKPGGVGTEMPLFMRPKVTKLIAKVTSPWAAFVIGIFVTLFLLPCSIGPYIILGGILVTDGVAQAIPSLLLYNLIFVLPMFAVTLLVYFGTKKVEDVNDWKDRNVRYMHLVSGVLLVLIGILMILGKF